MDWFCIKCNGEGRLNYKGIKRPVYVICKNCLFPSAYVWCDKCGMGGQIAVTDFSNYPRQWECYECGTQYTLPADFYQNPMEFIPEAFSTKPIKLPSRKFANISPEWLRNVLWFWERKEYIFGAILGYLFLLDFISFAIVKYFGHEDSPIPVLGFLAVFLLLLLLMLIRITAWFIVKIFNLKASFDKRSKLS